MMPRNFLRIIRPLGSALCGLGLLFAAAVQAQPAPNPELRQAVDRFMTGYVDRMKARLGPKTRIEYTVDALDNRLSVGACGKPLLVESKDTALPNSRINLQVSCQQGSQAEGWSIYLPVELSIRRQVVVAVKPLTTGYTVEAADVRLAEFDISQISGQYMSSLEEAIGKDVKRPVGAGTPVLQQQLVAPLMVRRGEAVMINASSSIVAVKSAGIALTDGRLGEQIRIKNQSSTRIVNARITGPGQAEVPM